MRNTFTTNTNEHADRLTVRQTHTCDARIILFDNYVFIMYAFFTNPKTSG